MPIPLQDSSLTSCCCSVSQLTSPLLQVELLLRPWSCHRAQVLHMSQSHVINDSRYPLTRTPRDCVLTPVREPDRVLHSLHLLFLQNGFYRSRVSPGYSRLLTAYYLCMTGHYPHTEEPRNEIGRRTERRRRYQQIKEGFSSQLQSSADVGQSGLRSSFLEQTVFAELLHLWLDGVLILICTLIHSHMHGNQGRSQTHCCPLIG